MKSSRVRIAAVALVIVGCLSTSACASLNPFKAQASVAAQGMDAAATAELTGALENSAVAVKSWQAVNGHWPTVADFAGIDGAAHNSGVTVTYTPRTNGFCLTGTTSTNPVTTGVWLEPGGLQPAGTTC